MKWMIELWRALWNRRFPFPTKVEKYWYCGVWHTYRDDERMAGREFKSDFTAWPIEGQVLFNPWRCEIFHSVEPSGLIDGLIPAIREGEHVGLYKVTETYGAGMWYDGLPWDDGKKIDLELVRVVHLPTMPADWKGFDRREESEAA